MTRSASPVRAPRQAFTLTELMAVVAIVGIVAAVVTVRASSGSSTSKSAGCAAIRGDIEVQAEIWRHNVGAWPATNLSDIGANSSYFPSGAPTCPVTGGAYTINSSGRVVGHNH
ncbi:MAG TPA: type II secretion system protein [Lacipirellulaceae bacterium]|nr:type II secretion system protein [Lacipirellulaceae bacterium]